MNEPNKSLHKVQAWEEPIATYISYTYTVAENPKSKKKCSFDSTKESFMYL